MPKQASFWLWDHFGGIQKPTLSKQKSHTTVPSIFTSDTALDHKSPSFILAASCCIPQLLCPRCMKEGTELEGRGLLRNKVSLHFCAPAPGWFLILSSQGQLLHAERPPRILTTCGRKARALDMTGCDITRQTLAELTSYVHIQGHSVGRSRS